MPRWINLNYSNHFVCNIDYSAVYRCVTQEPRQKPHHQIPPPMNHLRKNQLCWPLKYVVLWNGSVLRVDMGSLPHHHLMKMCLFIQKESSIIIQGNSTKHWQKGKQWSLTSCKEIKVTSFVLYWRILCSTFILFPSQYKYGIWTSTPFENLWSLSTGYYDS